MSNRPHTPDPRTREAGVMIAVAERFGHHSTTPILVPSELAGYIGHVRIATPGSEALHVIAV